MKTYSSKTKEKRNGKRFFMKNIYAILLGATALVIAGVVTLALVLGSSRKVTTTAKPQPEPPAPTQPTFSMPISGFTGVDDASLEDLKPSDLTGAWRTHNGVDFLAAAGTSVTAAADGKVTEVEKANLEATVVTVTHSNGFVTVYKGLKDVTVKEGDEIKAGDSIGTVAEVMRIEAAKGPHLHLEMTVNGELVDPLDYLPYKPEK